jgi:lipopolysaccharide export system permease protein
LASNRLTFQDSQNHCAEHAGMKLLQRYILGELLRVFALLLSALTVLLVFVGVFRQVSEFGLGPLQVLKILPFVVPSLMPFTIPATLLLTVCVVYGRIAGDQEVTAAKAAGINVLSLLWPAFLVASLASIGSMVLTDQAIPWAVENIQRVVTHAMEDIFLDQLRAKHTASDPVRGYAITVWDVRGKTLIHPVFEYTPSGGHNTVTVQAEEATIKFDMEAKQVILHMVGVRIDIPGRGETRIKEQEHPFPLPFKTEDPKPRHLTIRQLNQRVNEIIDDSNQRQDYRDMVTAASLLLGDYQRLCDTDAADLQKAREFNRRDLAKLKTEIHSRFALSSSCLFFVLLGGPFSIMQAKRQFLISFFICFLPILVIYYPIALLMLNLAKTSYVDPVWAVWVSNGILLVASLRLAESAQTLSRSNKTDGDCPDLRTLRSRPGLTPLFSGFVEVPKPPQ